MGSFRELVLLSVLLFLSLWGCIPTHGYIIGDNPFHRAEWLDFQGLYYFEWRVDQANNQITINVTAGTTGYALFGLANNASAGGSDIIVAGVLPNGEPYFSDRYALGSDVPSEDATGGRNYQLLGAWENKTHTTISFSRALDTCDSFDYPITDNKATVIWGYGITDDYETARIYGVQGSSNLYLLDPEWSPRIGRDRRFNGRPSVVTRDNLQAWSIRREIVIPANNTAYICSIHKAPRLRRKHHMVGFDVYFHSQGSRRRVHHVVIYKCNAPGLSDPRPVFEPYEGGDGESCFLHPLPPTRGSMPTHLCTELWMGWTVGGRSFFTPPHVGIPFGEESDEYYMVQTHYNNPEMKSGVVNDMRLDFFYTSNLRSNEGGMMMIAQSTPAIPPSILVPPKTASERIFAHCSAECTTTMLPRTGIQVTAGLLHSHNSGKRMRLRHFRRDLDQLDEELPWILYDDNYANTFQQMRHLKEEVRLLPGDQLTMECDYDNTWTDGSVVGGFSIRQEACVAILFYYNRISDYSFCTSEIVSEEYRQKFLGVGNVTWDEDKVDWVVETPSRLAGLTITQVSDNHVTWDQGKREELQRFHESHPQVSGCSRNLAYRDPGLLQELLDSGELVLTANPRTSVNTPDDFKGLATYPFRARQYIPEQSCSYNYNK